MVTTSTTPWHAVANGTLNDSWTNADAEDVNQFLGTHLGFCVYQGSSFTLNPAGSGVSPWALSLSSNDVDQPFTLLGTSFGRALVPILPVGNGADLLVSVCLDSSGKPGDVVTQTRIPASWINQMAVVSGVTGPDSELPTTVLTGNPLAANQFNSLAIGAFTTTPYSPPATGNANIINPAIVSSGNYLLNLGGTNQTSGATVANVFMAFASGTTLGPLIPQPALPQTNWTGAAVATSDTLVLAGGFVNSTDTVPTTNTFCASWDPVAGTIGSWSAQVALPQGVQYAGVASWDATDTVYIIGGQGASGYLNTVYWAAITNGQITAWNTAPPLPVALSNTACAAINGFLVVVGGENSTLQNDFAYYAPINADGSLGNWILSQTGATPSAVINGGNQVATTADAILVGGLGAYSTGVSPNGLGFHWSQPNDSGLSTQAEWLLISGNGADYQLFTADPIAGRYRTASVTQTPLVSVPLRASGLTNGATYHLLIQQQGGDDANYLRTHLDLNAFPGNPTALTSARNGYTWTALTPSGTCVPITLLANLQPAQPTLPVHMINDSGAQIITLINATTPDQRLLGVFEATQFNEAVNQNSGFEFTLNPWTATGGTAVQSSTRAYLSNFSCQVTPTGSASVAFIQSEFLPCWPKQQIVVSGWFWFTNAVTTNASISINWWNQNGPSGFISTSSNNVSVPAATWTFLTNTFTAPSGAYQFTINPALSGTPSAANVFYVDGAVAYYVTGGKQISNVNEVTWSGTWPGMIFPPTGTTQLA